MLRGLKVYTPNITAIVTVMDDGGGSGILRDELGMLPPGDIRNCIEALSSSEQTMARLLNYRFESGSLKGQSFGNLFLAAMNGISDSFDQAVARTAEVLAITGRVLPVTNEDVHLEVELENGVRILGESNIAKVKRDCGIRRAHLVPERVAALEESIRAISEADAIIIGPGSLYSSLIPNLLVEGISDAIKASTAVRIYVCNIMTEPGETPGYSVSDHIRVLFDHAGGKIFDYCLANRFPLPNTTVEQYTRDGSSQLFADTEKINDLGVEVFQSDIAGEGGKFARHDPHRLAREIMSLFRLKSPTRLYGV